MLFTNKSFHVFQASSLEERMQEIRKEIQPIFQQIGEKVCPFFTEKLDTPFYLHIAQHRRKKLGQLLDQTSEVIRWMPTSRSVLLVSMLLSG